MPSVAVDCSRRRRDIRLLVEACAAGTAGAGAVLPSIGAYNTRAVTSAIVVPPPPPPPPLAAATNADSMLAIRAALNVSYGTFPISENSSRNPTSAVDG